MNVCRGGENKLGSAQVKHSSSAKTVAGIAIRMSLQNIFVWGACARERFAPLGARSAPVSFGGKNCVNARLRPPRVPTFSFAARRQPMANLPPFSFAISATVPAELRSSSTGNWNFCCNVFSKDRIVWLPSQQKFSVPSEPASSAARRSSFVIGYLGCK